jgi:hypothetical protein
MTDGHRRRIRLAVPDEQPFDDRPHCHAPPFHTPEAITRRMLAVCPAVIRLAFYSRPGRTVFLVGRLW